MWLLYYRLVNVRFYDFYIHSPYKAGYQFNEISKITIDNKIFDVIEVNLRKGESNKNETKKLLDYLHSFDSKVEWVLLKYKKKKLPQYVFIPKKLESNF